MGRPAGLLWLDADVLTALCASSEAGKRNNDALRDSLALAGNLA